MNQEDEVMISAALDCEQVDLERLGAALSTKEGRDILACFTLLRAAIAADGIRPGQPLKVAEARGFRMGSWFSAGPRIRVRMAASIAVIAATVAFWIGTAWRPYTAPTSAGPVSRSDTLAPAAIPDISRNAPANQDPMVAEPGSPSAGRHSGIDKKEHLLTVATEPPKATRHLRFIPGVDWHPKS